MSGLYDPARLIFNLFIMKRLIYLLFALPLFFVSCSDDDDLPNFQVQIDMKGQTEITDKGVIVVPQGTPFTVESITIVNPSVKDITLGGATYYWSYVFQGSTLVAPFGMVFNTENLPLGSHLLQIYMPVFAVDYSPAEAVASYTIKIVEPLEENEPTPDTPASQTVTPQIGAK